MSPDQNIAVSANPVPGFDFGSLGIVSSKEAQKDAFARVLLLAPPKCGKTSVIATTAPGPVLIGNADGPHATAGAANLNSQYEDGQDFLVADGLENPAAFAKFVDNAIAAAEAGAIRSVAVDSVTLMIDAFISQLKNKFDGFDLWSAVAEAFIKPYRKLKKIPAHLFLTSHITAGYEGEAGIAPAIAGQLKTKIPGSVNDIILMDCVPGRKPYERCFILGPQGKWTSSGRNITKSCVIEADIAVLLKNLGIEP